MNLSDFRISIILGIFSLCNFIHLLSSKFGDITNKSTNIFSVLYSVISNILQNEDNRQKVSVISEFFVFNVMCALQDFNEHVAWLESRQSLKFLVSNSLSLMLS